MVTKECDHSSYLFSYGLVLLELFLIEHNLRLLIIKSTQLLTGHLKKSYSTENWEKRDDFAENFMQYGYNALKLNSSPSSLAPR